MKWLLISTLLLAALLAVYNLRPSFVGGSLADYANADHVTTTAIATQRDQQGHLLFVIAWTAKHGAGSVTHSGRNLLTAIHGHPIHPSLDKRAVYGLQLDYSLKQIPLTEEQTGTLLREMQNADFHTSHNGLWQKEIAPHLAQVETQGGN
jgi:hypothetical protein